MFGIVRGPLGLAALLALLISQAHSVWALCCFLEEAPAAVEIVLADSHTGPQQMPAPNLPRHGPTQDCPLGLPGAMGGCVVAAAIPTGTTAVAAIEPANHKPISSSDTLPRHLFGTDLFRPPRA
jgi:hypothetical protein